MEKYENTSSYDIKLDLDSLLRDVIKRLPVILILSAIVAMSILLISVFSHTPEYESDTTFIVTTKGSIAYVNNNITTAQSMATVFPEIIKSTSLQKIVAEEYQGSLSGVSIDASVVDGTNLLNLSVKASDPISAYTVSTIIIENYDRISDYIYANAVLDVLSPPVVATASSNPLDKKNIAMKAFIIALMLLVVITAVVSYLRDTVKSESDIEEKLECELLATVVKERRRLENRSSGISFSEIRERFKKKEKKPEAEAENADAIEEVLEEQEPVKPEEKISLKDRLKNIEFRKVNLKEINFKEIPEKVKNKLKSIKKPDLTKVKEGFNNLASRVKAKSKKEPEAVSNAEYTHLISDINVSFGFVEAFKKVRSKIEGFNKEGNKNVILVTSSMESEGKSTAAANVALALAKSHDKVVLIDADLRSPSQKKIFGRDINIETGLGGYLSGNIDNADDIVIKDEETGLSIIMEEERYSNAAELLAIDKMKKLVKKLSDENDYVIIDTPPVSQASDAEIICTYADGVVLVVGQDIALVPDINDAITILSSHKAEMIGCVYNLAQQGWFGSIIDTKYGYGYGSGYGYGYGKYGDNYGYGYGSKDSYGYGYGYGKKKKNNSKELEEKNEE